MTAQELTALADRVAAWHNRHLLAVRITPEQVRGMGWVSLPFFGSAPAAAEPTLDGAAAPATAPPTGSLRERAVAAAQESAARAPAVPAAAAPSREASKARQRAFDERFIEPWQPRRIASFAARHGRLGGPIDADQPLRDVQADRANAHGAGILRRYVRTAAVEVGDRRSRLLVAPDSDALWGRRLLDRRRLAVAGALIAALVAVPAAGWLLRSPGAAEPGVAGAAPPVVPASAPASGPVGASAPAVPASPVASSASAVVATAPAETRPAIMTPPPPVPTASAVAASAAPSPGPAAAVELPRPAAGGAVDIRPRLSPEQAREARRESGAVRAGAVATPPPASAPAVLSDAARPAAPPAAARPMAPLSAMTPPEAARAETPALPTPAARPAPRAQGERNVQVEGSVAPSNAGGVLRPVPAPRAADLAAGSKVFALVARPTRSRAASDVLLGLMHGAVDVAPGRRIEVLPVGDAWRATWWPFASRRDAEQAQAQLARLGIALDVVEF